MVGVTDVASANFKEAIPREEETAPVTSTSMSTPLGLTCAAAGAGAGCGLGDKTAGGAALTRAASTSSRSLLTVDP